MIIYLLISAAFGFYAAALLKDSEIDRKRYIIENLLLLAVAVILILISPRALGNAIIRLIGIIVLAGGIALIIFDLLSSKNEIEAEVTVKDEDDSSATASEATAAAENHDGDAATDTASNDGDL